MKTENPNLVVIVCEHTHNKVLFDLEHNICLHNDTVAKDLAEVAEFETQYPCMSALDENGDINF